MLFFLDYRIPEYQEEYHEEQENTWKNMLAV